jgi:hypothetical protein
VDEDDFRCVSKTCYKDAATIDHGKAQNYAISCVVLRKNNFAQRDKGTENVEMQLINLLLLCLRLKGGWCVDLLIGLFFLLFPFFFSPGLKKRDPALEPGL